MNYAEKQNAEIATIVPRTFKLNLSDADVTRLYEKAAEASIAPEQLLENFIGDLVCGTHTNGSDERTRAEEWFDRCWFSLDYYGTFLAFLVRNGLYNYFVKMVDDVAECTEEISLLDVSDFDSQEEYDEELEYLNRRKSDADKDIKDMFDDYCEHGENPETKEKETERVLKYRENLKKTLAHENERTV